MRDVGCGLVRDGRMLAIMAIMTVAGCRSARIVRGEEDAHLRLVVSWCGLDQGRYEDSKLVLSLMNEGPSCAFVDVGLLLPSVSLLHFKDGDAKELATEPYEPLYVPELSSIVAVPPGHSLTEVFRLLNITGACLTNGPYRVVFEYNTETNPYFLQGTAHPYPASWRVKRTRVRSNELKLEGGNSPVR